ncbi:MAG: hemerythrin domain-containing protein [Streptosporangiaceae bacterium]
MTITGTEAYEAMRAHHRVLGEQLSDRVSAVAAAAAAGRPHEVAVAGLIAYLAGEILPHAAAEEATIYPAAAALDGLAGKVSEMTAEHKVLSEAAGRLAEPAGAAAWAALREPRADLAVRVTAALHRLARRADPAPAQAGSADAPPGRTAAGPRTGPRRP